MLAVQDFFSFGKIFKHINHSIISLIPKYDNVDSPNYFRSISYCNVIYKVISKLLSDRLARVLPDIISPLKNAILGGYNIYLAIWPQEDFTEMSCEN